MADAGERHLPLDELASRLDGVEPAQLADEHRKLQWRCDSCHLEQQWLRRNYRSGLVELDERGGRKLKSRRAHFEAPTPLTVALSRGEKDDWPAELPCDGGGFKPALDLTRAWRPGWQGWVRVAVGEEVAEAPRAHRLKCGGM